MATKALINTPHHDVEASIAMINSEKQHMNITSLSPNNSSQSNNLSHQYVVGSLNGGETFAQVVANATPTSPTNAKKSTSTTLLSHEEDDSSVHLFKDCLEAASHLTSHPLVSVGVHGDITKGDVPLNEDKTKGVHDETLNNSITGGTPEQLAQQEEPLLPKGSTENSGLGGGGIIKRFFWKKHSNNSNKSEEKDPKELNDLADIQTNPENESFGPIVMNDGTETQETESKIETEKNEGKSGKQAQKHFVFNVRGAKSIFSLRNKMNAYHSVEGDDTLVGIGGNEMQIKSSDQCHNDDQGTQTCELHGSTDESRQETSGFKEDKIDNFSSYDHKKENEGSTLKSKFGGCKKHYIIWNSKNQGGRNNHKSDTVTSSDESKLPILTNFSLTSEPSLSHKIQMEQIFNEPTTYRSYDFVWNSSKSVFTFISLFLYRIITFVLAIPLTIVWAIIMSIMCVVNVWFLGPMVTFFTMWMELIQRIWGAVCKAFVTPLVEAFTIGKSGVTNSQCCSHACVGDTSKNLQHVINFEDKNGGLCMKNGSENAVPKQDTLDGKMYPEIVPKLV